MEGSKAGSFKEMPLGIDATTEEEYASQSRLLQEFTGISSIDKAWIFKSDSGIGSQAMFSISQPNLLANKRKKFILSSHVLRESNNSVNFQWAPFPVEMTGVSVMVPSPSGAKLLVVRDPEKESPCQFEIWGRAQVEKEFHIPQSVHGSVYADGWFQGISWNSDETLIAYVAEEPCPSKPTFTGQGYKNSTSADKDLGYWTGQGDWKEEWGETYAGKQQAALFVMNINSGETQAVKGIEKSLSVGQVVWAPPVRGSHQYLVFVGWSEGTRKLGIKYCFNRPCALYAVRAPNFESKADGPELKDSSTEDSPVVNLTQSITSALYPQFSPDGKFLLFLSARSAVDSGVHSATDSLHIIDWPMDGVLSSSTKIVDVVESLLSSLQFSILKIPIRDVSYSLTKGATKPFEAIFVSSKTKRSDPCDPLIVFLHGGPHIVSLSSFSKSLAFLSSIGFNLLIVNYRGSLGFGEEALQSLPGNIGSQDVNDVLVAIDHVIDMGLASPSKIAVLGGSHGGFLTTHLIGQAPDKFAAAATRNPACNLALMVGTTDIPDWCYVEAYGSEGKNTFTEAPSAEHLTLFHRKSPISHSSKVKTPTLFLLGAQDIRLPFFTGLQYAQALKAKGVPVKVIVFPNDTHAIERPQSDFESFLNIGVWFKKYLS
ncbi:PREDICTED: acylamino-acid-releasing enzyme-like isoform X2 [Prunus mume]|uniref:acylaminoacyl-peptidase n=1 Tax=Prunus mume TaxID=102107 RepID=A0ABM1LJT1_PRUMU|nr:PREDICTED: acylamino-acid-releasing enzyme-like isoform X2 [Prunus mume]